VGAIIAEQNLFLNKQPHRSSGKSTCLRIILSFTAFLRKRRCCPLLRARCCAGPSGMHSKRYPARSGARNAGAAFSLPPVANPWSLKAKSSRPIPPHTGSVWQPLPIRTSSFRPLKHPENMRRGRFLSLACVFSALPCATAPKSSMPPFSWARRDSAGLGAAVLP